MPPFVNSEVSYAKITLPFPVYAADFDPYNRGYLVVAGGGGESRSGVRNQISVLDVSNRATITTAVDLELSRDEDSVQSLANLATKDGLITLAGINSSRASLNDGNNEHFRSFEVKYPPRKKQKTGEADPDTGGAISLLGKRRLFRSIKAPKQETYQRLLRLSPARKTESGSKRIGAIASSLAKDSEIVVLDATSSVPDAADVIATISLPEKSEAADLDIVDTEDGEFSLAYCDDYAIHEQTFRYDFASKSCQKRPDGPRRVHNMTFPDTFQSPKSRAKFRCLRFLNPENLIALVNKPNKSGAELRLYHLYPTGPAIEVHKQTLPYHIRQASSLDVCVLDPDEDGNHQVVVAVAAQDMSIETFTTNFSSATDTFSSLKGYLTLRHVHDASITSICFAPFHSPPRAPDPDAKTTRPDGETVAPPSVTHLHPGPQYVRLASASFGGTVVIDTFPLSPLEPQNKKSRYVLSHPGDEAFWRWAYIVVFSFVVLVMAFILQSFSTGFSTNDAGVFGLLPRGFRSLLDAPAGAAHGYGREMHIAEEPEPSPLPAAVPTPASSKLGLRAALEEHHGSPEDAEATAIVVRDVAEGGHDFDVAVHPDKEKYMEGDHHAKHWHDLTDHQRAYWKQKLIRAGQWAEHEGEGVLKGVLWSTYAGLVGDVAGEILREL